MKYSKKLVKTICDELATGNNTIADTCKKVGISEATFYHWKNTKLEFSEALKSVEGLRLEKFKDMAKSGLAKLLDMHKYEEVTTEYTSDKEGKPVIKNQKKTTKFIMPSATAVIFTLTNREPEEWKHKEHHDHTSNGKGFFDFLKETSIEEPDTDNE